MEFGHNVSSVVTRETAVAERTDLLRAHKNRRQPQIPAGEAATVGGDDHRTPAMPTARLQLLITSGAEERSALHPAGPGEVTAAMVHAITEAHLPDLLMVVALLQQAILLARRQLQAQQQFPWERVLHLPHLLLPIILAANGATAATAARGAVVVRGRTKVTVALPNPGQMLLLPRQALGLHRHHLPPLLFQPQPPYDATLENRSKAVLGGLELLSDFVCFM